jgi:hypothetical protein
MINNLKDMYILLSIFGLTAVSATIQDIVADGWSLQLFSEYFNLQLFCKYNIYFY